VEIILHFGGCYRQDQLMKLQLNFFDVQNAAILGEIMRDHDEMCNKEEIIIRFCWQFLGFEYHTPVLTI
jgi:hypothetical protein